MRVCLLSDEEEMFEEVRERGGGTQGSLDFWETVWLLTCSLWVIRLFSSGAHGQRTVALAKLNRRI